MDNNFEVIQQSLELSCTVEEGMEYISGRFAAGLYEDALVLLQDVVQAFISIQQAVGPIFMQLPPNELDNIADIVRSSLDHIVTAYERRNWAMVSEIMQYQLFPAYLKWKEELQRWLTGYVAS